MTAGMPDIAPADERTAVARRVLFEAVLLGVLADATLRNMPDGLGWTVWVAALAFVALRVAHRRDLRMGIEPRAWLGAAVLCAAAFAWRDAEELRVYNVFGTLVALSMFAMAASGRPAVSIVAARIRDVFTAGAYTIRDIVAGTPVLVFLDASVHTHPALRGGKSWGILRAILLTVPLVLVFGVLFSRADPVFASAFRLPQLDIETIVGHVFITGAFAWWSAGYIRGSLLGVSRRDALPQQLPVRLGTVEVTTSLGAVNALFAFFVLLQLRWLFGGAEVVLATTGLTVAEYARAGFFELVGVAALVLPLILVTRAAIEDEAVVRRHRQLSLALLVMLGAVMASALLRMQLYVSHFGLTTDRLYATAIMAWLAMVAAAMVLTVFRNWTRPFATMSVVSGFLTIAALNVANPEQVVARVNLGRAASGHEVDYVYLARLHGDAMPLAVPAIVGAAPSAASCEAAQLLQKRWLERPASSWNLGARSGRAAVEAGVTQAAVDRLCVGLPPAGPAAGVAR